MLNRRTLLKGLAGGAGAVAASSIAAPAEARGNHTMPEHALGLLYDGTLCIGCRACIPACKEANGMPAERTELAAGNYWDAPLDISGKTLNVIKAYRDGAGSHKDQVVDGFAFTKVSCMHCVDPSCVSACPVSAMTKDPVTGIVTYDADACIGCRYCVAACPFGVPRFTYDTPFPKISKCQLCQHRLGKGRYAACAEVCPTGATLFGPVALLEKEIERRRSLAPGAKTTFPRGRVGSADSYEGIVGKYVEHTYGSTEIGGTQVLHLSGVPFELLGKPALPDVSPAARSETLQRAIYNHLIAPLGFFGVLALVAWRHMRPAEPVAAPGAPPPDRDDGRGSGGEP
ncbi:MAG: hydrogenase 2 operon protein HybA [Deltaproteobacteria bacterium]|nr:MAG: hydrogenase 2 operon protein HybA [Deltaproteobacteria bacterium]